MKWPRPIMCGLVFLLVNAAVFSAGAGTGAADFDNVPPALIVELLYRNNDLATPDRPMYRSPGALAVSPDKKHLYVAEETAKRVAVVSTSSNAVEREILLPNQPTGLAVSVDGSRLFVTCASEIWPSGYLHEVSIASGGIARSFAAGHFARSPVLSKDESQVFVCNQFDNTVGVVDLNAGRQTAAIPMVREPFHASLTPDGKTLVVANSLPLAKANDSDTTNVSSFVSLIDTDTRSLEASIRLPAGSHSVFGTTVTPDGRYAFVSYLFANYFLVADQLTAGWVHTNNCAIVDLSSQRLLDVLTLDQAGGGAANPWGVGVTDDGKYLCTVHSGSNELHRLDVEKAVELASTRDTYRHMHCLVRAFALVYPCGARGSVISCLSETRRT